MPRPLPPPLLATTRHSAARHEPEDIFYITVPAYADEKVPARRLRWMSTIENIKFSQEIIKQLTSPNAFSLLARSAYDQIFSAAYENFIRSERTNATLDLSNSLFDIRAQEFSTVPDMYLKLIANFASDIARSLEENSLKELMDTSLIDWLFSLEQSSYSASQRITISSPGQNVLQSSTLSPIFAAVLFAVCQFTPTELQGAQLVFVNSANGGSELDECDIAVAEGMKSAFALMSLEKLEALCRASRKAKELGSISTPINADELK